jgi:hypothetical protein
VAYCCGSTAAAAAAAAAASVASDAADDAQFPLKGHAHRLQCCIVRLLLARPLLLQHQLSPMLLTMRSFRSKAMHIACSAA